MSSEYLKTASCEIICHCDQVHCLPDPKHVPIDAICFSISESRMYTGSKSFIFHCLNNCTVLNRISFSFVKSRHPVLNSSQVELIHCKNEANLLRSFFSKLHCEDPDFLIGYDLEKLSFGYILKRSKFILNGDEMLFIGRSPTTHLSDINQLIGETYAHNEIMHHSVAPGRELINIWKQYRHYHNPKSTDLFSAILNLLSVKFPIMSHENLSSWVSSSDSQHMKFALKCIWKQTLANFMLISKMDIIPKISASSRINGVIFHDAYNRGSQFQVESIMIRNSRKYNYLLPSVSVKQRNYMAPIMSIPLTLEPATKFYTNPVIVLDFQSLYPSIMIAFNYCYTTCLGLADNYKKSDGPFLKLGALYYEPSCQNIKSILDNAKFSPNGTGFVDQKARQGMLPSLLKQLLRYRILAKAYMKRKKSDPDKAKDFDFLQMGLKLLSNVFFGYTAAGFSGRMPCSEVADSIIGKAVQILQISINYVNSLYNVYHCKVVYGDTDSIFVEICLENITVQDSFDIAQKLIEGINSQFPWPIKIKLEKIYKPCLLISKKRYVGFAYENKSDSEPKIDDKGIETVRKDSCPFVSTIMRECLEIGFQTGSAFHIRNLLRSYIDSALNYEIGIENFIMTAEVKSSSDHSPDKHTPLAQTIQDVTKFP